MSYVLGQKLNASEYLLTFTCKSCSKVVTTNSGFLTFEYVGKSIRAELCINCWEENLQTINHLSPCRSSPECLQTRAKLRCDGPRRRRA